MNNDSPLIDIHTHKVQASSGITIVNIILHQSAWETSPSPLSIKENKDPFIYFSAGIHPWFLSDWESQVELLKELVHHPKVIAIGECGLDKAARTPMEKQNDIFNLQVSLSEQFQKPLIIHCVKAYNELIQARKVTKPQLPWIIHGFNSSLQIAKQCIDSGMAISLGKSLFTNSSNISDIVKWIPISNLFLETDENDLLMDEIYRKCAEIKGISLDQLKFAILQNFNNYFKF